MQEILSGLWDIDEIGSMVHAYLWQWGKTDLTLIDCGMPGDEVKILAALRAHGFDPAHIRRIIITHADVDHMGSLRVLKQTVKAPVACHSVEKDLMEHPGKRTPAKTPAGYAIRPLHALISLLPKFRVAPVRPDQLLVDSQVLAGEGFTVIHTPGHTPGHISLLHKEQRFLIVGDALANRKDKLGGPAVLFTPDPYNAQRSIWKLGKKYANDFDIAVFGHGVPILTGAGERIKQHAAEIYNTNGE